MPAEAGPPLAEPESPLAEPEPRPADAEIYRPWCVGYPATLSQSCTFATFEQCMETARGGGGVCTQNPWYLQYGERGPALAAKAKSERSKPR